MSKVVPSSSIRTGTGQAPQPDAYSSLRFRTRCGVVGGVGPEATADFYRLVVQGRARVYHALKACAERDDGEEETLARIGELSNADWTWEELQRLSTFPKDIRTTQLSDQHHFPLLIHANPQIPDRSNYILHRETSPNPEPFLLDTVESLLRAGANLIAIPCNTAHYFLPAIEASFANLPVRFLHLPRLAAAAALARSDRIAVLATTGTLASQLYQRSLWELGHEQDVQIFVPEEQAELMETIYGRQGIKAGFADATTAEGRANRARLYEIVANLAHRGARAVIAGCTELPLLLSAEQLDQRRLPPLSIINPTACLADEVVRQTLRDRY